jgi:hypothetical protein
MIFVDSNIILDIVTQDPTWYEWSAHYLENLAEKHRFAINAIVYSEVSIDFTKIEDLEAVLPSEYFEYVPISWEVAFLAGKCFLEYRRNKGTKTLPLPDFFIGAHAAILNIPLITRDTKRYKTYFPTVELICP